MNREKFIAKLFKFAGTVGALLLVPQYFMEGKTGVDYPPPITHPEFFYGFIGVALAWQFVFFIIASDPVRYRPIMLGAALEKMGFGVAAVVLASMGRAAPLVAGFGIMDLSFAASFLVAYKMTGSRSS